MLKNYKPYGELDLTGNGYLFYLTQIEYVGILSDLNATQNYDLASDTDLSNTYIKSTLDISYLKEIILSQKFNKITCDFIIEDDVFTVTLNKFGNAFVTVSPKTGGIVGFGLLYDKERDEVSISFGAANLILE